MTLTTALLVLGGLLLAVAGLGVVAHRSRTRTKRLTATGGVELDDLGRSGWGSQATVVQFSTEFCARCPGVRRTLTDLAVEREGVEFVHIDLTKRPDLARKYQLLQTPAVFFVDRAGATRSRLSGVLTRQSLTEELDALVGVPA